MHSVDAAKLVCIGGGHGLGRLLSSLTEAGPNLTGIVATTDEGGSTGRLREEAETIAWGDLRNCLTQMSSTPTVGKMLFDYRFQTQGDLNGHNLGNLVLFALEQLSIRPTDAIQVMRDMLRIDSHLYPMSDTPTTLMAKTVKTDLGGGNTLVGEIVIDDSDEDIEYLYLEPKVSAEPEVVQSIMSANAIILSAGSFMTSIMPSLLVENIVKAINETSVPLILVVNLRQEVLGDKALTFAKQLALFKAAGVRKLDHVIWPTCRLQEEGLDKESGIVVSDMGPEGSALHDIDKLKAQIFELIKT